MERNLAAKALEIYSAQVASKSYEDMRSDLLSLLCSLSCVGGHQKVTIRKRHFTKPRKHGLKSIFAQSES